MVMNLPAMQRTRGLIPRLGRSPGKVNGYPLQYSCLKNSIDRGAWQATVHGVAESDTTEQLTLSLPMGGFDLYAWRDRDGSPAVVLQMVVRYPEANRGAAIF